MNTGQQDEVPEEARRQQFLAFYQKELALYIRTHLDEPVAARSLDKDLHPVFKVLMFAMYHMHLLFLGLYTAPTPCLKGAHA